MTTFATTFEKHVITSSTTNQCNNNTNTTAHDDEDHSDDDATDSHTVYDHNLWLDFAKGSNTWAALEDGYVTPAYTH